MGSNQPLAGIRVVDLTRNVAGPTATMILADLGATVVKVEQPGRGDDTRQWGPPFVDGESPMFRSLNRNKESITLNLQEPEAREILTRLVRSADILVESFRPGALEALGLGYEWARGVNPGLIYCSVTGYGAEGPMANHPGYDPVIQAFAGLMTVTGEPGRPPVRVGFSVIDIGTGLWTALAAISALYRRQQTGEGDRITTALYETALAWITLPLSTYWADGQVPQPYGSGTSTIVPYRAFPTSDGYLIISAGNDSLFRKLAQALEHPEWPADPRFASNPLRVAHRAEVDETISRITVNWTSSDLEALLTRHGIPCSQVRNLAQVAADAQAAALGIFRSPEASDKHDPVVALPLTTLDGRPPVRTGAPRLGEHSEAVLTRLGYSPDEIRRLVGSTVLGSIGQ